MSVAGVVGLLFVLAVPSAAQRASSVTIAPGEGGLIQTGGCTPDFAPFVVTAPAFVLTRIGDTSAALTVSLSWSDVGSGITVLPTSATFAVGSSTVTVAAAFSAVPSPVTLTLAVVPGDGYEVGEPASANNQMGGVTPACLPLPVPAPPLFTG
jgi:hypothetical protein